jgi:hypothetical protein
VSTSGINPSSFDRRAAVRAQADAVAARIVRTAGTVETAGSGEGQVDVTFPNLYIEKPALSFGGELAPGSPLVAGQFPTVSVIVVSWVTLIKSLGVLYTGARLCVVTTGVTTQGVIVHWQAEGKALSSPLDVGIVNSTGTA